MKEFGNSPLKAQEALSSSILRLIIARKRLELLSAEFLGAYSDLKTKRDQLQVNEYYPQVKNHELREPIEALYLTQENLRPAIQWLEARGFRVNNRGFYIQVDLGSGRSVTLTQKKWIVLHRSAMTLTQLFPEQFEEIYIPLEENT